MVARVYMHHVPITATEDMSDSGQALVILGCPSVATETFPHRPLTFLCLHWSDLLDAVLLLMFANGAPITLIIMIKYSQGWRGLGSLTYLDTLAAHESLISTLKLSYEKSYFYIKSNWCLYTPTSTSFIGHSMIYSYGMDFQFDFIVIERLVLKIAVLVSW